MVTRFVLVCVLGVGMVGAAAWAQTPQVCGPGAGLEWDANVEPDMQEYRVYASPEGTAEFVVVATVPHDESSIVTRPDGSKAIEGGFAPVADGLTEFYVTALDVSGNESNPSDHLVCEVKLPPDVPTGLKIIIRLVNP